MNGLINLRCNENFITQNNRITIAVVSLKKLELHKNVTSHFGLDIKINCLI